MKPTARTIDFLPPEGVPIPLEVAPLSSRIGAFVIDVLIVLLGAIALLLLMLRILPSGQIALGLFLIMFVFLRLGYLILAELIWNGVTPGKRLMGLRVVSRSLEGLDTHALVARGLTREAEVVLPVGLLLGLEGSGSWGWLSLAWIALMLFIPLRSVRRQRIGDFLANTMVVVEPKAVLLPDLTQADTENAFTFQPNQLELYGAYELQTLESVLRANPQSPQQWQRHKAALATVTEKICAKIDYGQTIAKSEQQNFLRDFYRAQRAHLEQRQLFGDRRTDKFHSRTDERKQE